jgi:hypothetical protein
MQPWVLLGMGEAIEFAASWKPLVKSKIRATSTITKAIIMVELIESGMRFLV